MGQAEKPVVVEQIFKASVKVIWEAITEIDQMKQWFFNNIPEFKPVIGFQTEFAVQSDDRIFTHKWRINEVIPYRKISYNWSYEEYTGEGNVSFELFENDNQTLLRLTNEGLESFPQEIPEFSRASCESGWDFFIKNNLKECIVSKG